MPMAPPKFCQGPGPHTNGGIAESGELCNTCRAKSRQRHDEASAARRARYGTQYEKTRKAIVQAGNVLCQAVDDCYWRRCRELAEIAHHILGTRDYPQFLLDGRNIVMVCRTHHPVGEGDDPGINRYIPTIAPTVMGMPLFDYELVECMPGDTVAPGDRAKLWSLSNRKTLLLGR